MRSYSSSLFPHAALQLTHVLNWEPVKAREVGGVKGTPVLGSLQYKPNRDVYTENGPSIVICLIMGTGEEKK